MKGLIICEPWISLIISGQKTWELRSRDTRVRGRIGLIRKGSKTVVGVADLVGTLPELGRSDLISNIAKHRVPESVIGEDFKWSTAWVLEHAESLREPIAYQHLAGAVVWVNLGPKVAARVESAKWRNTTGQKP